MTSKTLAHEFGHAFHNRVVRDQRPLNLLFPMTLAETASTFAETLLTDAMLNSPETSAQLKGSLLNPSSRRCHGLHAQHPHVL